jgi:hypothetical protein
MAAVLAHAIADGWTATAADWPISKAGCRGVDWTTRTETVTNTTGGGAVSHTARYVELGVGISTADATAAANDSGRRVTAHGLEFTLDAWHIFSDPANHNYIHVVYQFATQHHGIVFGHFSFGEINKEGMTHGGAAYASANPFRPYAVNSDAGNSAQSWNGGNYGRNRRAFCGDMYFDPNWAVHYWNSIQVIPAAPTPFPNDPRWPLVDADLDTAYIHDSMTPDNGVYDMRSNVQFDQKHPGFVSCIGWSGAQLYSGGVSMAALPLMVYNDRSSLSAEIMYLGSFPDVRYASIANYAEGDSITLGSEEWLLFPMLRKTNNDQLAQSNIVTSGEFAFAYKKVV